MLGIFKFDEQVTVGKVEDKIHCLHAMGHTMSLIVELSRIHRIIDGNLQVPLG